MRARRFARWSRARPKRPISPTPVPRSSPDFDRPETLRAALEGVERCLLLSAVDQRLVQREARFVEAATEGVRHLVKFSAIGAHPAAAFLFGRQHGQAEQLILASGVPFTFVQPNFFMQNLLWSASTIKARGEFYGTLGAARASHVDAHDIGRVIAAALTEPIDRHAGRVHLYPSPLFVLEGSTLLLAPGSPGTGRGGTGVYFNVESVDQAYKELTARGYKFNEEPYDVPVGRLVTINDPDGNIVELEDRSKGGLARVGS
jgi:Glyoxalase/Bleomycin resistance protein/Dioxygenase superfamily/NmrA-like family